MGCPVIQRYTDGWRRFWALSWWWKGSVLGGIALLTLVLGVACGGGGNDEDVVRATIEEFVAAVNDQDYDKLAQLVTANTFDVEPTPEALKDAMGPSITIEDLEIVSVAVDGDKATAEITRTVDGRTVRVIQSLVEVDGRWRLDSVESAGEELTADEELLASMVLTAQEAREALPEEVETALGGPERGDRTKGEVARWAQTYETAGGEMVVMDLRLYETAEAAADRFVKESDPRRDSEDFDVADVGDEAGWGVSESFDGRHFTNVHLRVDRVLALLAVGPSEQEQRAALLLLAQTLAENIEVTLED